MANNNSNTLVDEKVAISLFLDSLLRETDLDTSEIKSVVKDEQALVEPVVEIKAEVKIQEDAITENRKDISADAGTSIEIKQKEISESSSIVPEWANEPFQILLFEVAGLKLAVPLVELCGVIEWTETVTEMPGHADFYMGILQHLQHKIAVIDTARMVLPPKKLAQLAGENSRQRVKHIVLIGDYRWGLACDKIGEVITLAPEEVRWRTSKSSRSWLAGTVIEHMCALLNSEGFAAMLEKGHV